LYEVTVLKMEVMQKSAHNVSLVVLSDSMSAYLLQVELSLKILNELFAFSFLVPTHLIKPDLRFFGQ
jgi:hypothetical protein